MPITNSICYGVCSIQFSRPVMPDSLQPQGLQHARHPCPSPTSEACSNSYPSSQWCHPTISSSVVLFSACLQSFPATASFLMSLFFATVGLSIGASGSYSVLPLDISCSIDWLDLLAVQGSLKSLVQHHSSKASILHCSPLLMVQLSHPYMTTGKIRALIILNSFSKVMSLLLKMLSKFVIAFLQTSKHLLISWVQSFSAVILEPPKMKSLTVSIVSPSICYEVMGPNAMIFIFWMGRLSQMFHSPLSLSSRGSLVPLRFLTRGWCHLHIWGCWYFFQKSWFQFVLQPVGHFSWCILYIN